MAARQSGFYFLPLNPRARSGELKHIVQDSAPRILVSNSVCARPELLDFVLEGRRATIGWAATGRDIEKRFDEFLLDTPDSEPVHRTAGEVLTYTSGTTGLPRAVMRKMTNLTPEDANSPALAWYERAFGMDLTSPGAFLSACPLYFSGPLSFASYSINLGRTVVLVPQWSARMALALIARYRVTEAFVVPYQLMELLSEYRSQANRYDISSLRTIIHGSAPCPPDLKEQALNTFGDIIYESYGSTEVAGTVAAPGEARLHRGTVGRAIPPHEVKILDDLGQSIPTRTVGKVYMRVLPGNEFSYKGDPESTAACRHGDFATAGDLGFLDDSGYLYLTGRTAEAINCRGQKIFPGAIESAALLHPQVLDAVAFGTSCARDGESVHLAVRLLPSNESVELVAKGVLELLWGSLSRAEMPTSIFVVASIPREQSGKLRRREMSDSVSRESIVEISATSIGVGFPS
jgi:long-chain acyl-CoA synthetase